MTHEGPGLLDLQGDEACEGLKDKYLHRRSTVVVDGLAVSVLLNLGLGGASVVATGSIVVLILAVVVVGVVLLLKSLLLMRNNS